MSKTAIRHYRNQNELSQLLSLWGVVKHNVPTDYTIATKVDGNNLYYQFAVCSLKDQFLRKIGRELALQRLEDTPIILNTDDLLTSFQEALPSGLLSSDGFKKYLTFDLSDISSHFIFKFVNKRFKDIHNPDIEE